MRRQITEYKNTVVLCFCLFWVTGVQWAWAEPVFTIRNNGDPINRINLVILGDGYTTGELGKYAIDVENIVNGLFNQEPFKEYQKYFNVHRVDVISNQSGADHPELNQYKDTALDATYNCAGIQRLICINSTKVNNVLSASLVLNQWDMIVVIVNDSEYGGSGGALAVTSVNSDAVETILHELGHSFGLLADEYDSGSCINMLEPPYPNVTRETDRNLIKWNVGGGPPSGWIEMTTPIPTATTQSSLPGLYQGAWYCQTGLYRPTYNSKMRNLYNPFGQVNEEQLVKRIYHWVYSLDAVSPKENSLLLVRGQNRIFQVNVPRPATNPLDITWYVDEQLSGTGFEFTPDSTSLNFGSHTVSAVVRDQTPKVRQDPEQRLMERQDWTLQITTDNDNDGIPDSWEIQYGLYTNSILSATVSSDDPDLDGFTNLQEYQGKSNPQDPSSVPLTQAWTSRFNGSANMDDIAQKAGMDAVGNVYVTGWSYNGVDFDYITVKYDPSGNQLWTARYDNGRGDFGHALGVDSAGNVVVTGRSYPTGAGSSLDIATVKYDANGNLVWVARYDHGGEDMGLAMAMDVNDNVYVTGWSYNGLNNDLVTLKYDANGNLVWVARYDNGDGDSGRDIKVDKGGNVYVTGWSQDGNGGDRDYVTMKYSTSGKLLWVSRFDGAAHNQDIAQKVVVDTSGNVYVTGWSYNGVTFDYLTVKYDVNGHQLWATSYDNGRGDFGHALEVDGLGNVYVTGRSYPTAGAALFDIVTVKYDAGGKQLCTARYDHGGEDIGLALALDASDNVYVTGFSSNGLNNDVVTLKYGPDCDQVWVARYDNVAADSGRDIKVDNAGNVLVAGWSYMSIGARDYTTLKYHQ